MQPMQDPTHIPRKAFSRFKILFSDIQGVPENLCPVCLKTRTKQQKVVTIFWHDVARKMLN